MKEKILEFGKLLALSKKILLVNHVRMDPDAFGSLSAFYYILEKAGYEVKASNDDLAPDDFMFIDGKQIFENKLDIKKYNPDLIISFDAAAEGQLGKLFQNNHKLFSGKAFVVIDHHITNPGFGKLNIIDTKSSSTCELVLEILEILGMEKYIDPTIATFLLSGIYTDTNIYYNSNTTPKTLRTGAKLMEYGADFRKPIFEFFRKKKFNKSKLWGEVLKDLKKEEIKGKKDSYIYWGIITDELYKKTGTDDKDISGLINEFLANLEGMEVCFILYPTKDGKIKASFRSNEFNVSEFCQSFGGGGHKQASGFSYDGTIEDAEKMILENLKKDLN